LIALPADQSAPLFRNTPLARRSNALPTAFAVRRFVEVLLSILTEHLRIILAGIAHVIGVI
jgi:hypothetical protein